MIVKQQKQITHTIMQTLDSKNKLIHIEFSAAEISTDAGSVLTKHFLDKIGLKESLDKLFNKQEEKIKQQTRKGGPEQEYYSSDIIYQLFLGYMLGYQNPTKIERLNDDPVLKTILGNQDIASQTTFSRHISNFKTQDETKLSKLLKKVVAAYFENLIKKNNEKRLKEIKIDIDSTGIVTYGHQELANYSGHFDSTSYHPNLITAENMNIILDGILRPGNIFSSKGTSDNLSDVLQFLSPYFEKIIVKGDCAYSTPEIMDTLHKHEKLGISQIEYYLKAKNYVSWVDNSAPFQEFEGKHYSIMNLPKAYFEKEIEQDGKQKMILKDRYFTFHHQCDTWKNSEQIIARVRYKEKDQQSICEAANKEVSLIITNIRILNSSSLDKEFDEYNPRAKCEKTIEEWKNDSFGKHLSSHSFISNSCLFLLKCIAHNLMQLIRLIALKNTAYKKARTSTIRRVLFKIGGKIVRTARYIYLKLSSCFVYKDVFIKAFQHIQTVQLRI